MATLLRSLVLFLFGFAMLLVQSAVAEIVSLHPITPNLLLPIVIFLGVQQDIWLVRGAFLAFFFGFLLDQLCGSALGLSTFVMVAAFLVARDVLDLLIIIHRYQVMRVGRILVAGMDRQEALSGLDRL